MQLGMLSTILISTYALVVSASQSVLKAQDTIFDISKYKSEDRRLLRLHRDLIESESTSQLLERNAAKFLVDYFKSIGWEVQLFPTWGNEERSNVFAWPGKTNHTKLLVTSHIDTVPPYIPYSVHDGLIWGRGSADAKASVATQIEAIRRLFKKDLIRADDVAVLYVVGKSTLSASNASISNNHRGRDSGCKCLIYSL